VYEDRTLSLRYLGQVDRGLSGIRLAMANAVIEGKGETLKANVERAERNHELAGKSWKEYAATQLTVEEKKLADKFTADFAKYEKEALVPAFVALKSADMKAVASVYEGPVRNIVL